ncbi:hypothetical protein BIZ78_gp258 [Erwinia phage vB_EamM_Caitlin]|uniref:hypothetical protein n=1 Tax=Erwinia phage vB_EamM_Caitlin TaxID=1883379 RepID=UPI00081D0B00|nr:hypothetical protein BIZ78_gp258 [Erwinia phage vB_EamM_Caitlin]ANZ48317.1 hypothetical protein CAITLIN_22 [Erwinia phage vB_EamM_Caitlin]
MSSSSYFLIPDYQDICGPLSEFDPHAVLREINDDLNGVINKAFAFVETGSIGEDLPFMLPNTFQYIATELSTRGIVLEGNQTLVYGAAIQDVGKAFMTAVSTSPHWFTRYGKFVGARYSLNRPGGVEFLLDYAQVKFPQFESAEAYNTMSPKLLTVIEMLIGSLGGRL